VIACPACVGGGVPTTTHAECIAGRCEVTTDDASCVAGPSPYGAGSS